MQLFQLRIQRFHVYLTQLTCLLQGKQGEEVCLGLFAHCLKLTVLGKRHCLQGYNPLIQSLEQGFFQSRHRLLQKYMFAVHVLCVHGDSMVDIVARGLDAGLHVVFQLMDSLLQFGLAFAGPLDVLNELKMAFFLLVLVDNEMAAELFWPYYGTGYFCEHGLVTLVVAADALVQCAARLVRVPRQLARPLHVVPHDLLQRLLKPLNLLSHVPRHAVQVRNHLIAHLLNQVLQVAIVSQCKLPQFRI